MNRGKSSHHHARAIAQANLISKSGTIWGAASVAILCAMAGTTGVRADPIVVAAPCDATGTQGLPTCTQLLQGGDPLLATQPTPDASPTPAPGLLYSLSDRFTKQIKALYGYYPDPAPSPMPVGWTPNYYEHTTSGVMLDLDNPPGIPFGPLSKNVCDIVGINSPITIQPEINLSDPSQSMTDPNTVGTNQSCGQRLTISVNLGVTAAPNTNVQFCPNLNPLAPIPPGNNMWYHCLTGATPSATLNMAPPNGNARKQKKKGSSIQGGSMTSLAFMQPKSMS